MSALKGEGECRKAEEKSGWTPIGIIVGVDGRVVVESIIKADISPAWVVEELQSNVKIIEA